MTQLQSVQVSDYLSDPHQAVEIEAAIVGTMMVEPKRISDIVQIVRTESFYDRKNAIIFESIITLWRSGEKTDMLITGQVLKQRGYLDQVGGLAYLAKLTQMVGSATNIVHHCRIVAQCHFARKYVELGMRITATAVDKSLDVADLMAKCNAMVDEVNAVCMGRSAARHVVDAANDSIRAAEERVARVNKGQAIGIATGITELDKILNGFQPNLYILAARPSMGKTAIALLFGRVAADYSKANVCFYSLEMSDVSLADRLLLQVADVRADDYRAGRLTSEDFRKLENATAYLRTTNIYIDGNSVVSMDYIAAHSQMMRNQRKCDMIIVDYLQIIDSPNTTKSDNREREVAKMSAKAKQISNSLQVPFIMLSQLSRSCETRTDKRPVKSDLRDSGSIEQDADVIMFLYRPAYYKIDTVESSLGTVHTKGLLEIIVDKNRNGRIGSVPVWHNYSMTRFADWSNGLQQDENKAPY